MARNPLCAACGKVAPKKPGNGFELDGKQVPLCDGCWSDGENNEAWNDRITQRIYDRRAGRKPKRCTFSVLVTVKHTWSLRGVEAEDEDAAIAKVQALETIGLELHGHEIDCDMQIDSVEREHTPIPSAKKKARAIEARSKTTAAKRKRG